MTALEIVWHYRLELPRCVAVSIGDNHLVSDKDPTLTAVGQVQSTVVSECLDAHEDKIACTRPPCIV
jgi:hypothetical protein